MSKWDAMRKRETLHDFPCPREGWAKGEPRLRCYPELEKCGQDGECPYEFVYRQCMVLRDVVAAVLGQFTLEAEIEWCRNGLQAADESVHEHYTALVDAWEALS